MTENYKLISLPEVDSTNSYARSLNQDKTQPLVITTDCQMAGRGQRGNIWESEPCKNLTFSLVVYPLWLLPARQFELSMLVSIAIVNAIRPMVPDSHLLKIKWPNDIYYGDSKLSGILIENSIGAASIEKSIIGIGLNVNQTRFISDAPNPISLTQIIGVELSLSQILDMVVTNILDIMENYADDPDVDHLTWLYNSMLWRGDGLPHMWFDEKRKTEFHGILIGVEPDGRINITDSRGTAHSYLFKEVRAVLSGTHPIILS